VSPPIPQDLDPGIAHAVIVLRENGIETYESCEGGVGHAYPYPCVRFYGTDAAGWRALELAITYRLEVTRLDRVWRVENDHPVGPIWEMRFRRASRPCSRTTHIDPNCLCQTPSSLEESAARSGNPKRRDTRLGRSDLSSGTGLMESPRSPSLSGLTQSLIGIEVESNHSGVG